MLHFNICLKLSNIAFDRSFSSKNKLTDWTIDFHRVCSLILSWDLSSNRDEGKAEAEAAVPVAGEVVAPVRGTAEPCVVAPAAPPVH